MSQHSENDLAQSTEMTAKGEAQVREKPGSRGEIVGSIPTSAI